MIPKSFTQNAAVTKTQQNIVEYVSKLIQDVTQPYRFSDANQWVNAEPVTTATFENFPSPLYENLPPHTAVVSAVPSVGGHPAYFSQFYNPNLASLFPATATPTPAVCTPLALNETSHVIEAVKPVVPPNSVTFPNNSGRLISYVTPAQEQVPLQ